MAKRNKRAEEEPRELTRKEVRMRARDRERDRKLFIGVGTAIGLALLVIIIGAVAEFAIKPNSAVATIGGTEIVTKDFWKRVRLERVQMTNQLVRMQQLEQQFGGSGGGVFTSRINQLQATLASPFSLGVEVLDRLIDETVVTQKASERNITVSDEEIADALREEIAVAQGAVTEPNATATVEAGATATAIAAEWTPTPTPTIDVSGEITSTEETPPTPEPPAPAPLLTTELYDEGLDNLSNNLNDIAGLSIDEYQEVIRARLLNEKLAEVIGQEEVSEVEEQIHARHILLRINQPVRDEPEVQFDAPTIGDAGEEAGAEESDAEVAESESISGTTDITETATITDSVAVTETAPIAETTAVTETESATDESTETAELTETASITETAAVTETEVATGDDAAEGEAAETDSESADATSETGDEAAATDETVEPELRDAEATLALAEEIKQRLEDGEDFAELAAQYSDDLSNAANGGDLDWFGRGRMVETFEEAAFALEIGQISEPISTTFGYHIIEVLEKDENRPKDEATIERERQQAYADWLREQVNATEIERPDDLVSLLPRDLQNAQPVIVNPPPNSSAPAMPAADHQ